MFKTTNFFMLLFMFMNLKNSFANDVEMTCLQDCEISSEDVKNYTPNKGTPSQSILCYQKCDFTKKGYLEEDGTVPVDKIMNDVRAGVSSEEKNERYEQCLKSLPKISKNEDMIMVLECFKDE